MPHSTVKNDVDLSVSGLTIILTKAYSRQTKSRISTVVVTVRSVDPTISYMPYSDVVNREFIVFASELIIEEKRQYWWFAMPPCWCTKQKKICSHSLHKNGREKSHCSVLYTNLVATM